MTLIILQVILAPLVGLMSEETEQQQQQHLGDVQLHAGPVGQLRLPRPPGVGHRRGPAGVGVAGQHAALVVAHVGDVGDGDASCRGETE